MLALVIVVVVLAVALVGSLGALAYLRLRPVEPPRPDPVVSAALERAPHQPTSGGVRRLITVEILNPIELAGTRGRLAGIAGSLVPDLTRRMVYDQTLKILKQELLGRQVVADVRLHTLHPRDLPADSAPGYADDVAHVDLDRVGDQPGPDAPERSV